MDELSYCVQQVEEQFPHAILTLRGDFNCLGIEFSTGSLALSNISVNFCESLIVHVFAQDFQHFGSLIFITLK